MPDGTIQAIAAQVDEVSATEETSVSTDSADDAATNETNTSDTSDDTSADAASGTSDETSLADALNATTASTSDTNSANSSDSASEVSSTESVDSTGDEGTVSSQQLVAVAATAASSSGSEVAATITGVSIERNGNTVDEVSEGSAFYLVIDWAVANSSQILNEGDYFDITLPDTLLFPASFTDYEFDITDSSGTVVGTAYVTPGTDNVGGTVRIIFNSNIDGRYSVTGTLRIQAVANSSEIDETTEINIAVSTSTSSGSTDLKVDVTPLDDDELLGKWGVRSDTYSGQVYWYVRINYAGDTLTNATISDSLTGGDGTEHYVTDSFTLRRVTFASNGNVTTVRTFTSEELNSMLTFGEDLRSFTLDLSNMTGNYQYVLTYRTTYTSGTTLSNNVNMKSDGANDSTSSSYTAQSASGSADGTLANRIKITKVDANDTTTTLANATFLVTAEDGSTFTLTTGDDGTVTSDLLTAGTYTVVETSAPTGYELDDTVYTLEVSSSGGAVLTVEDTPITTSVTATKTWDDGDDQDGIRPDSVTVQLYADGEAYGDPIELAEDNGWTYTWSDLNAYSDGEEIVYTVEEIDVPDGYTVNVADNGDGTFSITNSHTPGKTVTSTVATTTSGGGGVKSVLDSLLPKTGDDTPYVPLALVAALAVGTGAIALARRHLSR